LGVKLSYIFDTIIFANRDTDATKETPCVFSCKFYTNLVQITMTSVKFGEMTVGPFHALRRDRLGY
jgi:hypothetical protein